MRVVTLLENTSLKSELKSRHGISLYIETGNKKILFDAGPDDSFLKNAEKLGIDLSAVDLMVLSHGHLDHGGGLAAFLKVNRQARVFLKDSAINSFFVKKFGILKFNIGLKLSDLEQDRLEMLEGNLQLNDSLKIYAGFAKSGFIPAGNLSLFTRDSSGRTLQDPFDHEICLLITSEGKNTLLTGCSHSGLGNMMRSVKEQAGIETIDSVIGGFHLFNPVSGKTESQERINQLVEELREFPQTRFYTGHCTGSEGFAYLKSKLGDQISEFKTGLELQI